MRDVRRYWQEIRALEQSLPQFVWLASVEGATVVEVPAKRAAQLLHSQAYRKATEEEVAALRQEEQRMEKTASRERLRRRGIAVVPVDKQ
jgi:uncharacterized glyoxalase superfamily metalloenzyme YdcJ